MDDQIDSEIRLVFLDEAIEYVDQMEKCLIELDEQRVTEETLKLLFRAAHNLKGSSQAVGFNQLGRYVHKIENVVAPIKDDKLNMSEAVIRIMIEANDILRKFIDLLRTDFDANLDTSSVERKLEELLEWMSAEDSSIPCPVGALDVPPELAALAGGAAPAPTVHAEAPAPAAVAASLATPPAAPLAASGSTAPKPAPQPEAVQKPAVDLSNDDNFILFGLPDESNSLPEKRRATPSPAPAAEKPKNAPQNAAAAAAANEQIKVSLVKLDNTLNSIGELVVYQNMLNQARKTMVSEDFDYLNSIISRLNVIVRDIQLSSFSLRMMPIGSVFTKMKRIVRDVSQKLDKPVDFQIEGEHIELDKSVVEGIADPLTHLIRNGLDHGIETREERAQTTKAPIATLRLSAKKESDYVIIEVQEDGKGLQKARILKKAKEKGIIREDAELSEEEIFRLIFASGFSTKEAVTELSGRGVGMDVVKSHVEHLGGEINIKSVEGEGTKFQIILPQSIAIIDGMVCEINNDRYIIPISHLHETLQVDRGQLGVMNQRSYTVRIRDEELPIFNLEDLLGNRRTSAFSDDSFFGIVSMVNGRKYVFKVSGLLGVQQIVVKPLGLEFTTLPGLAGSAVLGDGSAGIILDLVSLIDEKIMEGAA